MKTTRRILIALALAGFLAAPLIDAFGDPLIRVDARVQIRPQPRDLQVWIWPDRGEGAYYLPGENIYLNVEVTRDCFLVLYDIDTRGHLRILFPYDPWDDNFVRGGDVISFPRPRDGYEWAVDGPPGTEYIQAIATEFPMPLPDWPVYLRSVNHGGAVSHDRSLRDFRSGDDRLEYIRMVNRKITGQYWDWSATDLASFHVRRHNWRPRLHVYDPWPEIFYGEIYIGWPVGGRIYIDDIYIGVAPLWIPRHKYGRYRITCYDGRRLVRTQNVRFFPKRDYRFGDRHYRTRDVFADGYVKRARRGGNDHFDFNTRDYRKKDRTYRRDMRRDHALRKDWSPANRDAHIDRRSYRDRRPPRDARPSRDKVLPNRRRDGGSPATAMAPKTKPKRNYQVERSRTERNLDRARSSGKHTAGKKEKREKRLGWLKSAAPGVVIAAGKASSVKKRSKSHKNSSAKVASRETAGKKSEVKRKGRSKTAKMARISKSRQSTAGKTRR